MEVGGREGEGGEGRGGRGRGEEGKGGGGRGGEGRGGEGGVRSVVLHCELGVHTYIILYDMSV